ncbi:hypothetical protein ACHQM5_027775 [Ranunculus cassubicifolius]
MKVLSAYLLAKLGGNAEPSAQDLKKILGTLLLSQVNGKDLSEVIAAGREKMASVAGAGAVPVAVAAAAGGGIVAAPTTRDEEKKEEVAEDWMDGFSLFNGS